MPSSVASLLPWGPASSRQGRRSRRRLVASASLALVLVAGTALALDGGPDASILDSGLDGGILDGGTPDVVVTLDAASDAAQDATADAASDAGGNDGSSIKDAKSDVCDPNIEPCTTRADTGSGDDAGDDEGSEQNGGCSCDAAPAAASTTALTYSGLLLLAALALTLRRKK